MLSLSDTRASVRFTASVSSSEGIAGLSTQLARSPRPCLLLASDGASPGQSLLTILKSTPAIHSLILDTPWQAQAKQAAHQFPDLADVIEALPKLKRLFANGALRARELKSPTLEALYLLGDPLSAAIVETLSPAALPAVRNLGLSMASKSEPLAEAAMLKVVSLTWKALETLHVDAVSNLAGLFKALTKMKVQPQHVAISVSAFPDEDEFLKALTTHAAALKGIKSFALPMEDYISEPGVERAKALMPALIEPKTNGILPKIYEGW